MARGIIGMIGAFTTSIHMDPARMQYIEFTIVFLGKLFGALVSITMFFSLCITLRRQIKRWRAETSSSSSAGAAALYLVVMVFWLTGCSALVPSERQKSESVRASQDISTESEKTIERVFSATPQAVQQWGTGVVSHPLPDIYEQVKLTSRTATDAGSRESARGSFSSTIPLAVKLVLGGIGLFIIIFALKLGWSYIKSTGAGEALSLGDAVLAQQVRKLRERALTATDPTAKAQIAHDMAELEAERGKLGK